MTVTGRTGTEYRTYRLEPTPIGSGGEGDVFCVIGMDKVAKIYKPGVLTKAIEEKLRIMIEHPPSPSVLTQVAWPLDIIYDGDQCLGFIMPHLNINTELGEVYKYPSALPIPTLLKVNIAQNICVVISEVHKAGYVFGDFNPRNIGLDIKTGLVSFLDTDTYHVVDMGKDRVYRCNVCAPGYAAPELLEKCSDYVASNPTASKNAYAQTPLPTFTKETDNFALAIHIFKLLMNGYTPFGGIIETASVSQSSPGIGDSAVRRDSYCFKPGYKHQSAAIMPLEALSQEIADLFTRAFIIGKVDPKQRPNAVEWHGALERYEQSLVTCPDNPLHQYDRKNIECPLCEADRLYKIAVHGSDHSEPSLQQKAYSPLESDSAGRNPVSQSYANVQNPVIQPVISSQQQPADTQKMKYSGIFYKPIAVAVMLLSFIAICVIVAIIISKPDPVVIEPSNNDRIMDNPDLTEYSTPTPDQTSLPIESEILTPEQTLPSSEPETPVPSPDQIATSTPPSDTSPPSETPSLTPSPEETPESWNAAAYRAFYDVLVSAVNTYGYGSDDYYNDVWATGVYSARLTDINNDGLQELVYTIMTDYYSYDTSVYTYNSIGLTMLFNIFEFDGGDIGSSYRTVLRGRNNQLFMLDSHFNTDDEYEYENGSTDDYTFEAYGRKDYYYPISMEYGLSSTPAITLTYKIYNWWSRTGDGSGGSWLDYLRVDGQSVSEEEYYRAQLTVLGETEYVSINAYGTPSGRENIDALLAELGSYR